MCGGKRGQTQHFTCSYFSCSEELQRFCVTVVLCKVGINFQAAGVLQLFESWGVFWVYFQVTFRMFSPVIWAQKEKSDNNMYIVTYRSQRLCLLPCSPSATPVGERSRSLQVSSVTCGSPQNTLQLQPGALGLKAPQVLRVCTWPRGICFPHARCTREPSDVHERSLGCQRGRGSVVPSFFPW